MTTMYRNETRCQALYKSGKNKGTQCKNNAYYQVKDKYLCGVHSKKCDRVDLPKNPNKKKIERDELLKRKQIIEKEANKNKHENKEGSVIVTKLKMRKKPVYVSGFLPIFPNFKHENRKDGYGCSKLSPKSLGTITAHGVPISKNLENFHQFAKVYQCDIDEKGQLTEKAIKYRNDRYKDPIPYRHKYTKKELKELNNGIRTPLYSLFYDKDGNEHRYTYIECRYFYCHWYEKLVVKEEQYKHVCNLIRNGFNIQIVGYDGYNVTMDLYDHYLDPSRPFGHELVLYTMLTIKDQKKYPWNIYYKKHSDIYKNVI